ncbi:MAG: hypothetical protein ABJG47_14080 [Ekhidna sp.]
MFRILIGLIFAVCSFSAIQLVAQSHPPVSPIELPDKWEKWQETVPSSTRVLVGIQYAQDGKLDDPSAFYAHVPELNFKYLSVVIKSVDGRYVARINYEISNLKFGIREFMLPTKHKTQLQKYKKNNLSILCGLKNDLDDQEQLYTVAGWEDPTQNNVLNINILHRRSAQLIVESGDESLELSFEELPEPIMYFNQRCKVSWEQLKGSTNIWLNISKQLGARIKSQSISVPLISMQ